MRTLASTATCNSIAQLVEAKQMHVANLMAMQHEDLLKVCSSVFTPLLLVASP